MPRDSKSRSVWTFETVIVSSLSDVLFEHLKTGLDMSQFQSLLGTAHTSWLEGFPQNGRLWSVFLVFSAYCTLQLQGNCHQEWSMIRHPDDMAAVIRTNIPALGISTDFKDFVTHLCCTAQIFLPGAHPFLTCRLRWWRMLLQLGKSSLKTRGSHTRTALKVYKTSHNANALHLVTSLQFLLI